MVIKNSWPYLHQSYMHVESENGIFYTASLRIVHIIVTRKSLHNGENLHYASFAKQSLKIWRKPGYCEDRTWRILLEEEDALWKDLLYFPRKKYGSRMHIAHERNCFVLVAVIKDEDW